jgi:hypothetical protein
VLVVVEHAPAQGFYRAEPGIARQAEANTLATDAIILRGELEDRQNVLLRTSSEIQESMTREKCDVLNPKRGAFRCRASVLARTQQIELAMVIMSAIVRLPGSVPVDATPMVRRRTWRGTRFTRLGGGSSLWYAASMRWRRKSIWPWCVLRGSGPPTSANAWPTLRTAFSTLRARTRRAPVRKRCAKTWRTPTGSLKPER